MTPKHRMAGPHGVLACVGPIFAQMCALWAGGCKALSDQSAPVCGLSLEQKFGQGAAAQAFDGPPGAFDGAQWGAAACPDGGASVHKQQHLAHMCLGAAQGLALLWPQSLSFLGQHFDGHVTVLLQSCCQRSRRDQPMPHVTRTGRGNRLGWQVGASLVAWLAG